MKTATYRGLDGKGFTVEYDPESPCIHCGLPVVEASVGGTAVCPWCDMGVDRWSGERFWIVALHGDVVGDEEKYGCLKREIIGEAV